MRFKCLLFEILNNIKIFISFILIDYYLFIEIIGSWMWHFDYLAHLKQKVEL